MPRDKQMFSIQGLRMSPRPSSACPPYWASIRPSHSLSGHFQDYSHCLHLPCWPPSATLAHSPPYYSWSAYWCPINSHSLQPYALECEIHGIWDEADLDLTFRLFAMAAQARCLISHPCNPWRMAGRISLPFIHKMSFKQPKVGKQESTVPGM